MTDNKTIVIDTPAGIATFQLLVWRGALAIEVKCPGMKASRGNVFKLIKDHCGFKGTKASVLKQFEDYLENDLGLNLVKRYTEK